MVSLYDLDINFLAQRLPFVKWLRPQAYVVFQSRPPVLTLIQAIDSHKRPVTYHGGESRHSWFNICQLPPCIDEFDEVGIVESISVIEQLILEEVHNGIDPRRILLVGFSQGAALCLMTALTTLHELGGVASLSGWIPHRIREVCVLMSLTGCVLVFTKIRFTPQNIMQTDPHLPIFWSHGIDDTEIPIRYARNSIEFLEQRLFMNDDTLHYYEYAETGHEVTENILSDLAQWIMNVLSST